METQTIPETLETYISKKDSIGINELLQFRISPLHYEHYKKNEEKQYEEKNKQTIDEAINCFLQDQALFHEKYVGAPVPKYKSKKEQLSMLADTQSQYGTKTVIDKRIHTLIIDSCKYILQNDRIKNVFRDGSSGVSSYQTDPKTGLKIKGRLAWMSNVSTLLFDCKIYETDYRVFINNYFSSGNYLCSAWNTFLFNKQKAALISIDANSPLTYRVGKFDQESMDKANLEIMMLLDIYCFCKKNNYWFDTMQFEEIKNNVYTKTDSQGNVTTLHNEKIETVFNALNDFINQEGGLNQGYEILQTPKWIK